MDTSFMFTPIYSIGNLVAKMVAQVIMTTSGVMLPDSVVNTFGMLTMVTLSLVLVSMAKKITWNIVTICWALMMIKIGLLMLDN